MPAARQRSRSPLWLWAVNASTGSSAQPGSARIARQVAKPSITGIWQSSSTPSGRSRASNSRASLPLSAVRTR